MCGHDVSQTPFPLPQHHRNHHIHPVLTAPHCPLVCLLPGDPTPPRPLEETPLTWVDTPHALAAMVAALASESEVAIDLEAHSYRCGKRAMCVWYQAKGKAHGAQECVNAEHGGAGPGIHAHAPACWVVDVSAHLLQLHSPGTPLAPLAHHARSSFQGFTCLMQISTRTQDWLVDTLALRSQIGPALAALCADPTVVKVLHGADHDVLWLQVCDGLCGFCVGAVALKGCVADALICLGVAQGEGNVHIPGAPRLASLPP